MGHVCFCHHLASAYVVHFIVNYGKKTGPISSEVGWNLILSGDISFTSFLELLATWWLDINNLLFVKDLLFRPSLIASLLPIDRLKMWSLMLPKIFNKCNDLRWRAWGTEPRKKHSNPIWLYGFWVEDYFFFFLFSSPDPKSHVRYCHHLASIRRPSVNFFIF